MITDDIYDELKRRMLVETKAEFSRIFLGGPHNAYTLQKTRGRTTERTLVNLVRALGEHEQRDLQARVIATMLEAPTC